MESGIAKPSEKVEDLKSSLTSDEMISNKQLDKAICPLITKPN
jgi:hypothetical protein